MRAGRNTASKECTGLMKFYDVPLFPLNTVLFPKMILPLHIFEHRYRQMIADCIHTNQPFGVVLISEGNEAKTDINGQVITDRSPSFFHVGTIARITEVTRLDDGRLLINTVGTDRFRLLDFREEKPYITGDIEVWPDGEFDASSPEAQQLTTQVSHLFGEYLEILMELAHKRIEGLDIPEDPALLSYLIPHWLPQINMDDKQRLLEVVNPLDRLKEEMRLILRETEFLHKIKQRADQEAAASEADGSGSNGFGYNLTGRFSDN